MKVWTHRFSIWSPVVTITHERENESNLNSEWTLKMNVGNRMSRFRTCGDILVNFFTKIVSFNLLYNFGNHNDSLNEISRGEASKISKNLLSEIRTNWFKSVLAHSAGWLYCWKQLELKRFLNLGIGSYARSYSDQPFGREYPLNTRIFQHTSRFRLSEINELKPTSQSMSESSNIILPTVSHPI